MIYVWGELGFPPIYCGAVRPLSMYYYPLLMTLLDITKFNIYIAFKLMQDGHLWGGILAMVNVE